MKINCWEYKKCGREVGGVKVKELGVCPVALETRLDGTHEGKNAGRACWIVSGSLCGGEVQGSFGNKFKNCIECDFYKNVNKEEGSKFILTANLIKKINK